MKVRNQSPRHDAADEAVDVILGDDVDFGRYVVVIWDRLGIVAAAAVLCGAIAATVVWFRAPTYEASSTLAVSGSKIGDVAPLVATVNFRPLIENNSVAATVVQEFQLAAAPHLMTPESFLRDALSVDEVRNSAVIRIHVTMQDPKLAADVNSRVADLAVDGARRLSQNEAVQARDDIEVEVEQARKRLEAAAARLEAFRKTAQIELTREDVKAMLFERGRLLDLMVEIAAVRAKLQRGETDLAARQRVDSFTRAIDTDPALAQAARAAGETPSSVLGLQLKSEEVNKVYESLEEQVVQARADLAALESRRAQLIDIRKLDAQQQSQLTALYQKEAELARLRTEFDVAENSFSEIAARYDVARLQVAGRSAQLQVIDRAIVPSVPTPRHLIRNTLFAVLAGATLMVVVILLAQALGDVRRRAAQR